MPGAGAYMVIQNADDDAEATLDSASVDAEICSTSEPLPECEKLIDSMDSKNRKLKSELRKRDAISDTIGGHVYLFSMGEMWVTEPDGCYLGMRNLQN